MRNSVRSKWIDVSVPLCDSMVHWPGDPPVSINRIKDIAHGDTANLSKISMGAHSGTHVDAPMHFLQQGEGVDKMPLDTMIGRARVIEINDTKCIKLGELTQHHIRRGERILFKTNNSSHVWNTQDFVENFVYISNDAARFLVDRGVKLVGIDYLSVGSYKQGGSYVHKALLSGGIWIIEGLDLSSVMSGKYDLICLPLRIIQGDGAPARALLRPI